MHFFWLLPAFLLAIPLFTIRRIRRSKERKLCNRIQSVIQTTVPDDVVLEPTGVQTRLVKWISNNEFMTVLTECSDLIVVDIQADTPSIPFPVSTACVLPVTLNELDRVLDMLPADKSVVFCGASNLCIFLIETSPCMQGSAPLYLLEGDLRLAEVA
jgi:hypothetical protein